MYALEELLSLAELPLLCSAYQKLTTFDLTALAH